MRSLDQRPAALPGLQLRAPAPGRLVLTHESSDVVLYDGDCGWVRQWRDTACDWGYCVILIGSIGLYATWNTQSGPSHLTGLLSGAAAAGELAGVLATFAAD